MLVVFARPSSISCANDLMLELPPTTSTFSTTASSVIGAKSLIGSYGRSLNSDGLTAALPTGTSASVYPSGAALATEATPMLPAAPGLFSTITGEDHRCARFSATTRASASAVPPAANGTTMRIVWDGYLASSANAGIAMAQRANAVASSTLPNAAETELFIASHHASG